MYDGKYNDCTDGLQSKLAFIGPLTSNSIYPVKDMARLLEETIVNLNDIFNRYMLFDPEGKFKTNLYRRRDIIEDIINGKNVVCRNGSKIVEVTDLPRELKSLKRIPQVPKKKIGHLKYLF